MIKIPSKFSAMVLKHFKSNVLIYFWAAFAFGVVLYFIGAMFDFSLNLESPGFYSTILLFLPLLFVYELFMLKNKSGLACLILFLAPTSTIICNISWILLSTKHFASSPTKTWISISVLITIGIIILLFSIFITRLIMKPPIKASSSSQKEDDPSKENGKQKQDKKYEDMVHHDIEKFLNNLKSHPFSLLWFYAGIFLTVTYILAFALGFHDQHLRANNEKSLHYIDYRGEVPSIEYQKGGLKEYNTVIKSKRIDDISKTIQGILVHSGSTEEHKSDQVYSVLSNYLIIDNPTPQVSMSHERMAKFLVKHSGNEVFFNKKFNIKKFISLAETIANLEPGVSINSTDIISLVKTNLTNGIDDSQLSETKRSSFSEEINKIMVKHHYSKLSHLFTLTFSEGKALVDEDFENNKEILTQYKEMLESHQTNQPYVSGLLSPWLS